MAMPEFISNVEFGLTQPGWLNPATVADLLESDFVTLPPARRNKLYEAVERFKEIASAVPNVNAAEQAEARAALDTILDILQPYRTPESRAIREAVTRAWKDERDLIPTFDYELMQSWMDTPIVWIWLVLRDDLDVEDNSTQEVIDRVRWAIRPQFHEADIERTPHVGIRMESEVKEIAARATA